MYDIAIIGCGIIGAAAAYELSKYELRVAVIERENDIADETTKANSGIVHAGYDPKPGSAMAACNVDGAKQIRELCKKLSVHYRQCGSLVVAFNEQDKASLLRLYEQGIQNGVVDMRILSADAAHDMEPNLSSEVCSALYAPSAAIVDPWELCIALAETAAQNGVDFYLNSEVLFIEKAAGMYILHTQDKTLLAKYIVNAAGVQADLVHQMVDKPAFHITPIKGEYFLLDKNHGTLVNHIIFQCPGINGKGVLVSPTVHGNLIVGPNAEETPDRNDVSTTMEGLQYIKKAAARSVPGINYRDCIRTFAGVRAQSDCYDFIIEESPERFINLAGIRSPGLSASPAISKKCLSLLQTAGLLLSPKKNVVDSRSVIRFRELPVEQKIALVKENSLYGRVICRCETVTEGEIVAALRRPVSPSTVDGIKKRCNAGMGRCQGGFCGPKIAAIISRERKIPIEEILLNKQGTVLLVGETKNHGTV